MKAAVVFLTKTPQQHTIDFAKEVSKEFDTFIVVDDEAYECNDNMFIQVSDKECELNSYVGCNINEFQTHIPKKVIAWDKFLYTFCEVKTDYDFVWVFEDDVFIYNVNTLVSLNRYSKHYDLVVPNNNYKNDNVKDWHWNSIFDKISAPYYFSMVCGMGISKTGLSFIKSHKNKQKGLFHIEAMFNTICMQNGLRIKTPLELVTIVWKGEWNIDHFMSLKNNLYHPLKCNHYELRNQMKECIENKYKPKKNCFPDFVYNRFFSINNNIESQK